jgi:hypothetical protein
MIQSCAMESTPNELKAAISDLSHHLGSALAEIARLRADRWAVEESMKKSSPELYETYQRFRLEAGYRAILDGASYQIASVSAIPNKV